MLSCKEVTHLLSEAQEHKLSIAARLRLKMHLAICEGCANYRHQMDFIRRACRSYLNRPPFDDQ